jgi:hypothetical protein
VDKIQIAGLWFLQALDKDRKPLWRDVVPNTPTHEGLTALVTDFFSAGVQKPNWYGGLIDNTSFTAISEEDTASSHAGWVEFTNYVGATRKEWGPHTISNGLIQGQNDFSWEFSASGSVRGVFIISDSQKSGTVGTIWSVATFSGSRSLSAGQLLVGRYRARFAGGT